MAKVGTAPFVGELSGGLAGVVLMRLPTGTAMRTRVIPRNPRTKPQTAWRDCMRRAGQAYRSLTTAQHNAWLEYAQRIAAPGTHPTPVVQLFIKLGAKAYQANPSGGIPLSPPTSPFGGDSVGVTASAVAGGIKFTSNAGNRNGITTELLCQKLPSPFANAYLKHYRSKAFQAFIKSGGEFTVPCSAGIYACAIRFVELATGQATGLLAVGVVQVS